MEDKTKEIKKKALKKAIKDFQDWIWLQKIKDSKDLPKEEKLKIFFEGGK